MEYHNPVLLKESVDGLDINLDGYMWMLPGGGGHSREILSRARSGRKLFALIKIRMLWLIQSMMIVCFNK
jgi:16S rRNA (cytosine1402-N4)-methyltransferase